MTEVEIAAQSASMEFDRQVYFDAVRASMFYGKLTQQQVDGQEAILGQWETVERESDDLRHLAYMLATTKHETASTMWPIEEYGKGSGMSYGKPDPETGQTYYGRGYVQLTWRDNYHKADVELELSGDLSCEWHAGNALNPQVAADVMFWGMWQGWFRSGNNLFKFFSDTVDDAFGAREIINGDKNYHVSWDSRTIGQIIADYHDDFLDALEASYREDTPQPRPPRPPMPPLPPIEPLVVSVNILQPFGTRIEVKIEEGPEPDWDALRQKYEAWRRGN